MHALAQVGYTNFENVWHTKRDSSTKCRNAKGIEASSFSILKGNLNIHRLTYTTLSLATCHSLTRLRSGLSVSRKPAREEYMQHHGAFIVVVSYVHARYLFRLGVVTGPFLLDPLNGLCSSRRCSRYRAKGSGIFSSPRLLLSRMRGCTVGTSDNGTRSIICYVGRSRRK